MVKFADVKEGNIVQLGRFNKEQAPFSYKQGYVLEKVTTKIGNSMWSAIVVQTGPREKLMVQINNIKAILA